MSLLASLKKLRLKTQVTKAVDLQPRKTREMTLQTVRDSKATVSLVLPLWNKKSNFCRGSLQFKRKGECKRKTKRERKSKNCDKKNLKRGTKRSRKTKSLLMLKLPTKRKRNLLKSQKRKKKLKLLINHYLMRLKKQMQNLAHQKILELWKTKKLITPTNCIV
jgi:hypothetical protein